MTTNDAKPATNSSPTNGQAALPNGGAPAAAAPAAPPAWVEGLDPDGQALASAKGWKSAGDAVRCVITRCWSGR